VTEFTPLTALIGGVILGASALFLLWLNGNVAGISDIVSRTMQRPQSDVYLRVNFRPSYDPFCWVGFTRTN
jgi:uncharacterized membrane protein YedE/YeeE